MFSCTWLWDPLMLVVRNCVQQIFYCIFKVCKGNVLVVVNSTKTNGAEDLKISL